MRIWTIAAALALALTLTSAAAGAYTPRLVVSGSNTSLGGRGETTIDLVESEGSTTGLTLYAPAGYSARLDQAPGSRAGSVVSAVASVDGADVELSGELVATDPAALAADPCAPGPHAAAWLLALSGPGVGVSVPVFVDPAAGDETAYASYRIRACLGDVHLRQLTLRLANVLVNPRSTGAYTWRGLFTSAPEEAAVEARSTVLLPVKLVLGGRYSATAHRAVLTGSFAAAGEPLARQTLALWAGGSRSGLARTDARGRFEVARAINRATTFHASISVPAQDVTATGCADPVAPGGCVSAVVSPFTARSNAARVAIPRAPILRLGSRGADVRRLQERLITLRYLPWGSASGVFDERTWHAVVAFQGWQRLGRDGVVAARTWAALGRAHAPTPWGGMRRGLEVDVPRQVLLLVENGRVRRAIHVSTAAPGRFTPHGRFAVYRKETLSWSIPFRAWMPYANYFHGGFAIHGFASVPPYPASHGCIRVPMADATVVYGFAGYGTPVLIR